MRFRILVALVAAIAAPASAQDAVFSSDFEWGDTGAWSSNEPPRCDRVDAFGRGGHPTVEINVATWGNDSTGTGSAGIPYATISRAAQDAVPGSAILVHEGTYSGGIYLSDLAGTASAPIWIGGASGEARPIIDGGGEGIHLTRGRYLVIHDLSANAIQSKGGSDDIEIRWNRFTDAGARGLNLGGSTGFTYFRPPLSTTQPNAEARNIRAVANIFEGSDAAVAYVGCVGCVVANNTIIDPENWILRVLQEAITSPPYTFEACRDGVFVNNLVVFDRSALSTYLNIGPNTAPETFSFASNLWYAWDNPAQSQPSLPVVETNGIYGVNPMLGPGYRIGPSSPAAGSGEITPWTWGDHGGACYQSPPSRGAFEVR